MKPLLQSELLRAHGVPHAFSTRVGGASPSPFDSLNLGKLVGDDPAHVDANHTTFAAAAGVDRGRVATVRQVHGDRVVFAVPDGEGVERRDSPRGEALSGDVEADAVIALPGAVAGVRVADCTPILLHDPFTGASAAVHCGWRGTIAHLVEKTVGLMASELGVRAVSLRAAIGPSIGPCCFEVGDDLAAQFDADPVFGTATTTRVAGRKRTVDLFEANRRAAVAAGLKPHHVDVLRRCTSCESALFYSHRRDAGRTGRHLAVVAGGRF